MYSCPACLGEVVYNSKDDVWECVDCHEVFQEDELVNEDDQEIREMRGL